LDGVAPWFLDHHRVRMNSNELHSVGSNESIFRMKFAQAASSLAELYTYVGKIPSRSVCNFGSYDGDW